MAGCSDNDEDDNDTAPEDDGATDDTTDTDESDDVGNGSDDDGGDENGDDGNETDDDADNETDDEYDGEEADDEDEFGGEEADDEGEDSDDDDEDSDDEDESDEDGGDDEDDTDAEDEELDPDDYENEIVNDSPLEVAEFEAGDGCELTARITRPDGETAELRYDFVVYYGDEILSESRDNSYELDGNDSSHELTAVLEGCGDATHYGFELHGYEEIDRADDNDVDGYVSMEGGTDNVFSIQSHGFDGQNCQLEVDVYNETGEPITGFVWVGLRGDLGEQTESTEIDLEGGDSETITFGAQNCGEVRTYEVRGDVLNQ